MVLRTQHANVTVTVALGALLGASSWAPAVAQQQPDDTLIGEVRALARVVFEARHNESADGDSRLGWSNDFFRGVDGTIYVPFTLSVDPASSERPRPPFTSWSSRRNQRQTRPGSSQARPVVRCWMSFRDPHRPQLRLRRPSSST